jgi:hypothetical protein
VIHSVASFLEGRHQVPLLHLNFHYKLCVDALSGSGVYMLLYTVCIHDVDIDVPTLSRLSSVIHSVASSLRAETRFRCFYRTFTIINVYVKLPVN